MKMKYNKIYLLADIRSISVIRTDIRSISVFTVTRYTEFYMERENKLT